LTLLFTAVTATRAANSSDSLCAGQLGGCRWSKFNGEQAEFVEFLIRVLFDSYPLRTLEDYVVELKSVDIEISRSFVCRLFERWGLSYKSAEWNAVRTALPLWFSCATVAHVLCRCVGNVCVCVFREI